MTNKVDIYKIFYFNFCIIISKQLVSCNTRVISKCLVLMTECALGNSNYKC